MKIISEGVTRIVFEFEDYVMKIPWINLPKVYKKFKEYNKKGSSGSNRFDENIIVAILKIFFFYLASNRREYLYWQKHKEEKNLLPIKKAFLFGHIIIQPRGDVLSDIHPKWLSLAKKIQNAGVNENADFTPRNFCIHNGEVKLLDYGSDLTQDTLDNFGFQIIQE